MRIVRFRGRGRLLGLLAAVVAMSIVPAPGVQADTGPTYRPAIVNATGWRHLSAPLAGPTLGGKTLAGVPAPNAGDGIGPGAYLLIDQTDGNTYICTANFVWQDQSGKRYLGAAGHCFLPPEGPEASLGDPGQYVTRVQVCVSGCTFGGQLGSAFTGELADLGDVAYARQSDVGNDFGLVEIPAGTTGVRYNVPVWGGPSGTPATPDPGDTVCLYGNAGGLGEVFATKARFGVAGVSDDDAWFASIPSAPGDSGSAVVSCPMLTGGAAAGVLTHLATNGTGFIAGTTIEQAKQLAAQVGLQISIVQS
ncbi:MAG: hypothetical protein ACOYXM_03490 [Actinomycetota bacterium]